MTVSPTSQMGQLRHREGSFPASGPQAVDIGIPGSQASARLSRPWHLGDEQPWRVQRRPGSIDLGWPFCSLWGCPLRQSRDGRGRSEADAGTVVARQPVLATTRLGRQWPEPPAVIASHTRACAGDRGHGTLLRPYTNMSLNWEVGNHSRLAFALQSSSCGVSERLQASSRAGHAAGPQRLGSWNDLMGKNFTSVEGAWETLPSSTAPEIKPNKKPTQDPEFRALQQFGARLSKEISTCWDPRGAKLNANALQTRVLWKSLLSHRFPSSCPRRECEA